MARVLVVEDNATLAKIISFKLQNAGLEVSLFEQAEDALKAFQFQQFDVAVIDYMLPGMNGTQLIRRIRQESKHADMPIFLITAKFMEIDVAWTMHEYRLAGAFAKPFSPKKLAEAVLDNLPSLSAS